MQILKPSGTGLIITSIITILVMIVGAYEQLANAFFLVPDVRYQFEASISARFDQYLGLVDQYNVTANLITSLAWSVIGAFVFTIVWAITNVVVDVKNNLEVSATFVHPRAFHQSTFWGAYVVRIMFKAALVVMLVAGGVLWFTVFLPSVFTAEQLVLADSQLLAKIVGMLGIFLVIMISLQFFIVILRLLLNRPRLLEH